MIIYIFPEGYFSTTGIVLIRLYEKGVRNNQILRYYRKSLKLVNSSRWLFRFSIVSSRLRTNGSWKL